MQFKKTALMFACERGHKDVASILIEAGSAVEARNRVGYSPLMLAAEAGHADVIDLLIKHADLDGADRVSAHACCCGCPASYRVLTRCDAVSIRVVVACVPVW